MKSLGDRLQTADWKQEKHVPVIECPSTVKSGEIFEVKAYLGRAVRAKQAVPRRPRNHGALERLARRPPRKGMSRSACSAAPLHDACQSGR